MSLCINKNYPYFNHRDTFLLNSTKKNSSETSKLALFNPKTQKSISIYDSPSPSLNLTKTPNALQKFFDVSNIPHRMQSNEKDNKQKDNEYFPKISYCLSNSHSTSVKKGLIITKKNKNSCHLTQKSPKIIGKNILKDKAKDFLDYLFFLKTTKKPQISKNKEKFTDISHINSHPHSDIDNMDLQLKTKKIDRNHKFSILTVNTEKVKERSMPTFNSLSPHFSNNDLILSKKSSLLKNTKKRGSLSLCSNPRLYRVKNYIELIEIIDKLSKNITNLLTTVSNEKKAYNLVNEILFSNKSKYLKVLFFVEGKNQFLENLTPFALENACFYKASQFNVANNTPIYEEKMISSNIIQDLINLNEKIENYLVERNIKEMQNFAADLSYKIKHLSKYEEDPTKFFNYQNMPDQSVIDDIIELKNHYGNFENFDKKQIIIGKTIDEIIKNVKKNHIF